MHLPRNGLTSRAKTLVIARKQIRNHNKFEITLLKFGPKRPSGLYRYFSCLPRQMLSICRRSNPVSATGLFVPSDLVLMSPVKCVTQDPDHVRKLHSLSFIVVYTMSLDQIKAPSLKHFNYLQA